MTVIRRILLMVLIALFMPLCVSTPISYDTAQIPNDSLVVTVGAGGQYVQGRYSDVGGCGSTVTKYNASYLRGDVQVKYGFKRVLEVGVHSGMAGGSYHEYNSNYSLKNLLWFDLYPYLKFSVPTSSARISLKFAPGIFGGIVKEGDTTNYSASGYAFADIMMGFGEREFITFGLRGEFYPSLTFYPIFIYPFVSFHMNDYTLSFMMGFWGDNQSYMFKTYIGFARTFR